MKTILTFIILLGSVHFASSQVITALCDVLKDVEKYRADSTMSKLATDQRNFDGSYQTNIIPARFVETAYRDVGGGGYMLEFKTYGKPKQMEKVLVQLIEEIAYCYPEYIYEEGEFDTETFRQLFFCHPDDKGGSRKSSDYRRFTFLISILHTKGDQSKIVLKF